MNKQMNNYMAKTAHWSLLLLILLVVFACNPDDLADSDTESADTTDIADSTDTTDIADTTNREIVPLVQAVYTIMREGMYLWADFARAQYVDLFYYKLEDLENLLYDLKLPADRFTFILPAEEAIEFEGKANDPGLVMRYLDDTLWVASVEGGSPAHVLGITRGQWIKAVTLSGERVVATPPSGIFVDLTQARNVYLLDQNSRIEVGDGRGTDYSIDTLLLYTTTYDIQPISDTKVIDKDGKKVGYLSFTTFSSDSTSAFLALTESFKKFKASGVEYFVLDLRYNSGGYLNIAEHILNLLYAPGEGNVMYKLLHNKEHQQHDTTIYFREQAESLTLKRLYILTSNITASASEMIINCLKPYTDLEVILIGGQSVGKNVGSYLIPLPSEEVHTHSFFPIAFRIVNKYENNDFEEGFDPEISAPDRLRYPLGHEEESLLTHVLRNIAGETIRDVPPPAAGLRRRKPGAFISTRPINKHSIWLSRRKRK